MGPAVLGATRGLRLAFHNACQQSLSDPAGIHGFVESQRIDLMCVAEVAPHQHLSNRELAARVRAARRDTDGAWVIPRCSEAPPDIAVWMAADLAKKATVKLAPPDIRTRALRIDLRLQSPLTVLAVHFPPCPWRREAAAKRDAITGWIAGIVDEADLAGRAVVMLADENDIVDHLDHANDGGEAQDVMSRYGSLPPKLTAMGLADLWLSHGKESVSQARSAATHCQKLPDGSFTWTRKDIARLRQGRLPLATAISNLPPYAEGVNLPTGSDHGALLVDIGSPSTSDEAAPEQLHQVRWQLMIDAVSKSDATVMVVANSNAKAREVLAAAGIDRELVKSVELSGMGSTRYRASLGPLDQLPDLGSVLHDNKCMHWPNNSWEAFHDRINARWTQVTSPAHRDLMAIRDIITEAGVACVGHTGMPRVPRRHMRPRHIAKSQLARRYADLPRMEDRKRAAISLGDACWDVRARIGPHHIQDASAWSSLMEELLAEAKAQRQAARSYAKGLKIRESIKRRREHLHSRTKSFLDSALQRPARDPAIALVTEGGDLALDAQATIRALHHRFSHWAPPDPWPKPDIDWAKVEPSELWKRVLHGPAEAVKWFAPDPSVPSEALADICAPISEQEFASCLRRRTAPGKSGVSYQALSHCPQALLQHLHALCNDMLADPDSIPDWLGESVVVPVPKDPVNDPKPLLQPVLSVNSVRPIALQEVFLKLISTVLMRRIMTADDKHGIFPESMQGFRRRRGVSNCLQFFRLAREADRRGKVHTHEVEVDIAKAYDTARWPQVAAAMAAIGAPAAYIRLRAKMFGMARAQVLCHAGLTPCIAQDSLLQGDPLSVIEFNALMRPLARRLDSPSAPRTLQFRIFADDIKLRARLREDVRAGLEAIGAHLQVTGQSMAAHKTVYKTTASDKSGLSVGQLTTASVSPSTPTRYLGIWASVDDSPNHVTTRLTSAARAVLDSLRPGALTLAEFRMVWNTVAVPRLAYVAVHTAATRSALSKIDELARRAVIKLGGTPGTTRLTHQRTHTDIVFTQCKWHDSVGAVGLGLRSLTDWVSASRAAMLMSLLSAEIPVHLETSVYIKSVLMKFPTGGVEFALGNPGGWIGAVAKDFQCLGSTIALSHSKHMGNRLWSPGSYWSRPQASVSTLLATHHPYDAAPQPPSADDSGTAIPLPPCSKNLWPVAAVQSACTAKFLNPETPRAGLSSLPNGAEVTVATDGGYCPTSLTMSAGVVWQWGLHSESVSVPVARMRRQWGWELGLSSTAAELWAMALALAPLAHASHVHLVSDSQAALATLRRLWLLASRQTPFDATKLSETIASRALWEALVALAAAGATLQWQWVASHPAEASTSQQQLNEMADSLATAGLAAAKTGPLGYSPEVSGMLPTYLLTAALALPLKKGKRTTTLRTGDGQQPTAAHWRTALMRAAEAARAARVVSGSCWGEWSLPDTQVSRSMERVPPYYTDLASSKRWRGVNRLLIPAPESDVLTQDDWKTIGRAFRDGGRLEQPACRHALSLLTGNWWLPDETLWRLGQSGSWYCPKCGSTRPSTPHLISCGTDTSEAWWFQRLTPSAMDRSLTSLGKKHTVLIAEVNKTFVKDGIHEETDSTEAASSH